MLRIFKGKKNKIFVNFFRIFTENYIVMFFFVICSCSNNVIEEEFIMKVDDHIVTVSEFKQTVDRVKLTCSDKISQNPDEYNNIILQQTGELLDEIVLITLAEKNSIKVSDDELMQAVEKITKEYDREIFQTVLLENTISYKEWLEKLRIRLLIEKVVDHFLISKIVITTKEIELYRGKLNNNVTDDDKSLKTDGEIEKYIRREKAQNAYPAWINGVKKRYDIKINKDLIKKILIHESQELSAVANEFIRKFQFLSKSYMT